MNPVICPDCATPMAVVSEERFGPFMGKPYEYEDKQTVSCPRCRVTMQMSKLSVSIRNEQEVLTNGQLCTIKNLADVITTLSNMGLFELESDCHFNTMRAKFIEVRSIVKELKKQALEELDKRDKNYRVGN